MKRRQFTAIFTALAVSVCSSLLLVGCAGETYNYKLKKGMKSDGNVENYEYVGLVSEETTESKSDDAAASTETSAPAAESSAPATVSTVESSVPVSTVESSVPVSTVESSVPVSTVESSVEPVADQSSQESTEAPAAEGTVIKFRKPGTDKWAFDDVCAYVVGENAAGEKDVKNAQWPGVPMTAEGDNIYSYVVPNDILNANVIFNCNTGKVQFPRSKGVEIEANKIYEVE